MTTHDAGGVRDTGSPTPIPKLGCWSCGEYRGGIMGPYCDKHLNAEFDADAGNECQSFTYDPGSDQAEKDAEK